MTYHLIRGDRKTLGVEIRNGEIYARAPRKMPKTEIDRFLLSKREWIEKHLAKQAEQAAKEPELPRLSGEEIASLAQRAAAVIPERVRYYAARIGVTYGRITVRNQRSKWGSCGSNGNLNFNCLLMLAPPEVLDSVVVHELCHRKEMNHSPRFYAEVLRVFPDYKKWDRWLKDHGPAIMRRMTGK